MTNGNDYTSPQARADSDKDGYSMTVSGGLTKREYFAAMAFQGLISIAHEDAPSADEAVSMANELIEALNKAA